MWFEKFGRSSPFSGRPLCSWSETDQMECCCTKAPSAAMAIWMSLAAELGIAMDLAQSSPVLAGLAENDMMQRRYTKTI